MTADARGIVGGVDRLLARVRFDRFPPSAALAGLVRWYWVADWDRTGMEPHEQRTLPHPVVNVVFEPGAARVYGVQRSLMRKSLTGRGRAIGVMFRPGGFRGLLGRPLSTITDRTLPAGVLGPGFDDVHARVTDVTGPGAVTTPDAVRALDDLFVERAGDDLGPHPVTALAERVAADPGLTRVDQLAELAGCTPRQLQRMFADAVGVGPKWVIRRYRLLEAAERARVDEGVDWADVAAALGYSDQSHLVREFAQMVGVPPGRYARELASAADLGR